jgi:hypothetical protein
MACLRSPLATRTHPNAGLSVAILTTASPTYEVTQFITIGFRLLISRRASSPPYSTCLSVCKRCHDYILKFYMHRRHYQVLPLILMNQPCFRLILILYSCLIVLGFITFYHTSNLTQNCQIKS